MSHFNVFRLVAGVSISYLTLLLFGVNARAAQYLASDVYVSTYFVSSFNPVGGVRLLNNKPLTIRMNTTYRLNDATQVSNSFRNGVYYSADFDGQLFEGVGSILYSNDNNAFGFTFSGFGDFSAFLEPNDPYQKAIADSFIGSNPFGKIGNSSARLIYSNLRLNGTIYSDDIATSVSVNTYNVPEFGSTLSAMAFSLFLLFPISRRFRQTQTR